MGMINMNELNTNYFELLYPSWTTTTSLYKPSSVNITYTGSVECPIEKEDQELKPIEKEDQEIKPTLITYNDGSTVVYWNDGTRTAVRLCKEDAMNGADSTYTAFCIALAKKIYGSNSALHRLIHDIDENTIREKKEAERQKLIEEKKRREKINHDRKVRKFAKQMRLLDEASQLAAEEKTKNNNYDPRTADKEDILTELLRSLYNG